MDTRVLLHMDDKFYSHVARDQGLVVAWSSGLALMLSPCGHTITWVSLGFSMSD